MYDKLKKDMKTLRWIGARIRGQRGHLAWLTVSNILGAVLSVGLALVSKGLVDGATEGSFRSFALCLAALLSIVSVQMLLSFIDSVVSENMIEHLQVHFQDEMLGIYLSRDYQKISAYHSGELLNRLFSDVGIVVNGAISLLPSAVFMVIRLIAAAAVLLVIAPAFTVLFLVVGVMLTILMILMKERFQHLHKEMQEAAGRVRSFLQEIMSSIIVVKAYGAENRVRNRVLEGQENYRLIRRKRWKIGLAGSTGIDLIFNAGYFGAMIWGCLGILRRTLTYGSLTAMLQLVGQIQAPFAGFSGMITSFYEVLASAERLMEIAEMPESGAEESGIKGETEKHDTSGWHKGTKPEMDPLLIGRKGTAAEKRRDRADWPETFAFESICLDNVSFDYGREPVLKDLSFRINKGELVAITGPSGCGKSTLLMLLMGAYKPDQGSVRVVGGQAERPEAEVDPKHDEEIAEKNDAWIDGKYHGRIDEKLGDNLDTEYDVYAGRKSGEGSADKTASTGFYAYVPQGNYLFSGSLRDNVTFFNKEVSDEMIWQALKIACAEEFVRELPEGLDTLLGEKGHGLSEGQMQRLAIARAIYSGAPVLLLDEVTSALDAKTEAQVLEKIRNLKDRTCLIVTHKPKALSICDQRLEMGESEE